MPRALGIVVLFFTGVYLVVSTAAVALAGSTAGRVVLIDCALFVAVPALAAGFERGRDYLRRADPVRPARPVPLHLRVRLDSRGSFTAVVPALRDRGVAVLGSLDHDAILCFGLPDAIERTPGVRSATPFAPSEKVEQDLAAGRLKEWGALPGARIQLVATFWDDVPIERAKDLVRATGAEVVSSSDAVKVVTFAIHLTSALDAARRLAEQDEVARVAQPPPPAGIILPQP